MKRSEKFIELELKTLTTRLDFHSAGDVMPVICYCVGT